MNLHAARSSAAATPTPVFAADEGRKAEAGGAVFADLLDERRAARAADGARPGQRGAFDAAPAPAPAPARAAESQRALPAARERPRDAEPEHPRDAAGPARPSEARPATRQTERSDRKAVAARDAEPPVERRDPVADETLAEAGLADGPAAPSDDPLDSLRAQTVLDWLTRLDAATPSLAPAGATGKTDDTAALSDALGRVAGDPAAAGRAGEAVPVPRATGTDTATATATAVAAADSAVGAALLQDVEGPALAASAEPAPSLPSLVPLAPPPGLLGGAGAAANPAGGPSGMTLQLATPVTAPDFSQALATQLTTLAREGVQEATLQLNPAELGPIAVKIVLEGAQAQIDFAAEHARTREALEAGLPTLAAALHGAGLTLSGGGVFERRRGHDGAPSDAPRGGEASADAVEESVAAVTPRRALVRGLVDAYA